MSVYNMPNWLQGTWVDKYNKPAIILCLFNDNSFIHQSKVFFTSGYSYYFKDVKKISEKSSDKEYEVKIQIKTGDIVELELNSKLKGFLRWKSGNVQGLELVPVESLLPPFPPFPPKK